MSDLDVRKLFEEIKALTPPQQLRLAADLMDRRRGDVAYEILRVVHDELGAAIAIQRLKSRTP